LSITAKTGFEEFLPGSFNFYFEPMQFGFRNAVITYIIGTLRQAQ
jgi:hypothetical protein